MAGDWIKMRGNLWNDPRVSRLCDLTDQGEAAIIGGLYWLWATADQHSEDGVMVGLSIRSIDRNTGIKGFGDAMVVIGWIADHPEGIRIVRFDEHNGASAKKRCQTAKRVANFKAGNAEVTLDALPDEDDCVSGALPRERDREEKSKQPISEQTVVVETSPPAQPVATTKAVRGSRLPADWHLPKAWGEWALQEKPGWSADDVRRCADKFRDHWHAVAGRAATKASWEATWRNWVRNEQGPPARASPSFDAKSADRKRAIAELTGVTNEPRIEREINPPIRLAAGLG